MRNKSRRVQIVNGTIINPKYPKNHESVRLTPKEKEYQEQMAFQQQVIREELRELGL